jgi:cyanophycinase-like exopeptidase
VSGTLALLGGQEHTAGCEAIDRRLLDETGRAKPTVTVLLAATAPRRRAFKTYEALEYWRALGISPRIAMAGGPNETERTLAALDDTDLVVLTGGHPWLLHARLEGSRVLGRLLELLSLGVPLSGSSAGAIAMCEWRQQLQPPNPFRLVRAFGLVRGTAAAPHFNRYGLHRWVQRVSLRNPALHILGLDDRTALIGRDDNFTVVGDGGVTLAHDGVMRRFPTGAALQLGLG